MLYGLSQENFIFFLLQIHFLTDALAVVHATARSNVTRHVAIPLMPEGNYVLCFVGQQSQAPTSVGLNIQGFHP